MMRNAVGAALTGVALFVSGCAGDSQAQVGDSASASLGAADSLVLRTMTTGGFAGLGGPGTLPDFSLYGDGRAITGGREPTEYHLTSQALRRLVAEASKAGLATPRTVDDPSIADATYKVITFVVGGRARTTKVIQEGGRGDDPAKKFLARLVPANWPRGDQASAAGPYHPSRVAVLAVASPGSGPKWPFGSLTSGTRVGTSGCTVLAGADAGKAQRMAASRTQWNDRGKSYRVRIRPLLPDERDCAPLSR